MNIEIIAVDVEDKGKYKVADVSYKADGKTTGKKVMSFGNSAQAFKILANAKQGETFSVKSVKNDKNFWDWVSVEKSEVAATVAASKPNTSPRSTYETPEERALRQKLIIRQSSISSAIEYYKLVPKKTPDVTELLELASTFERHVWGTKEEESIKQDPFQGMVDDIPF